ncbi:MAG TPA: hypothetical protein VFQ61_35010, partial [Polyangiaceae bacterium]|nr:hypothetical protein [Polyangiaceae bacterium]
SPYHALALALSSLALWPIWGLARETSFPTARGYDSSGLLRRAKLELQKRGFKVAVWARIPDGGSEPDELRLLLRLSAAAEGALGIELGVDAHSSPAGYFSEPFVLVRVQQDSRAQSLLSPPEGWQRGRRGDERVGIWRPRLPALFEFVLLAEELGLQLSESSAKRRVAGATSRLPRWRVASPAQA